MVRKFYRRRFRRANRDKFEVENHPITVVTPTTVTNTLYQLPVNIAAPSATEGVRKIKHITCTLTAAEDPAAGYNHNIWWAIVFVPEGYTPNAMNITTSSIYEPNQFVLCCGVNDPTAGPIRIRCPLSRNLNSGDSLWIIVGSTIASFRIQGMVSYAISYN